jgi:hypothetical protein
MSRRSRKSKRGSQPKRTPTYVVAGMASLAMGTAAAGAVLWRRNGLRGKAPSPATN